MDLININTSKCNYIGCIKKIKVTDFPCKCKKYYCKNHMFPNLHNCQYDYKEFLDKNKKIEFLKCSPIKLEKI